jgi:vacuolar iron transporter family protein
VDAVERASHRRHRHPERHTAPRRGQSLRAGVLGANDGLLSIAALLVGVASGSTSRSAILLAGVAALVAGALSMAVGEFSSVSAQRDAELADLAREARELRTRPDAERAELADIYRERGLSDDLAAQVADELMDHGDVLAIHARDELGINVEALAQPVRAAVVSAISFLCGGVLPLLAVVVAGRSVRVPLLIALTLLLLAVLGAVGARLGGASARRAALRVLVGGAVALAVAAVVGRVAGTLI